MFFLYSTLPTTPTFDKDIALAVQQGVISLDTDENYSVATLTNAVLVAQGASATLIGSQGDDQLVGNATTIIQTGKAGQDTFRGGAKLEYVLIIDYTESEDVVYHGRRGQSYRSHQRGRRDATLRTKDIQIIGSPDDNTIISSSGN